MGVTKWLTQACTIPTLTILAREIGCVVVNKQVSLTPKTNNKWRKLRASAFQRLLDLGVADRVFMVKY
jgi:hypothetical protein